MIGLGQGAEILAQARGFGRSRSKGAAQFAHARAQQASHGGGGAEDARGTGGVPAAEIMAVAQYAADGAHRFYAQRISDQHFAAADDAEFTSSQLGGEDGRAGIAA